MTIRFRTMPDHNLAILEHIGRTPDDEFLAFYKEFFDSDNYASSMNLLVDLRKADSSPRSKEVLRDFAGFVSGRLAGIVTHPKVAVVASQDLSFGLARMYEVFADSVPWDFVVFRAIDAALAWLGLPENLMARLGDSPSREYEVREPHEDP